MTPSYVGQCKAQVKGKRICKAPANTPGAAKDFCVKHYKMHQRKIPFDHVPVVLDDADQVTFKLPAQLRKDVQKVATRRQWTEAQFYRWAVGLALLAACGPVHFAERKSTDIECGRVKHVDVSIQHGAWLECPEALAAVTKGLAGRDLPGWRVLYVAGFAGFDVDRDEVAHTHSGGTYAASRTIAVVAGKPWLTGHELAHADDLDHGLTNTRDM